VHTSVLRWAIATKNVVSQLRLDQFADSLAFTMQDIINLQSIRATLSNIDQALETVLPTVFRMDGPPNFVLLQVDIRQAIRDIRMEINPNLVLLTDKPCTTYGVY